MDDYPCNLCVHYDGDYNEHCASCMSSAHHEGVPTGFEAANDDKKDEKEYFEAHYSGTIQPLEYMQAQMSQEEFRGFLKGNIIKYVSRCGKKDDPVKEMTKVLRYAECLKESYEGKIVDPRK